MIFKVHNVFHIYLLKKYIHDNSHIIHWKMLQVEPEGGFLKEPLCILDLKWKYFTLKEGTWEEDEMHNNYPALFQREITKK